MPKRYWLVGDYLNAYRRTAQIDIPQKRPLPAQSAECAPGQRSVGATVVSSRLSESVECGQALPQLLLWPVEHFPVYRLPIASRKGQLNPHTRNLDRSVVHDKAQIAAAQCHGARRFTGAARMYSFNAPTGTRHLSAALVPESLPLANKRMTMLTGTCSRSATWRVVRYSTVISPFAASSWPGHSVQNNKCPLAASAETPHAPRFLRL